ncbi:PREDICTED: ankyrin repeat-containing protein NPR4-like [Ipomoea nil]|uniref:ankyrin repeat-containing protein NPR4-like n=1 Tax=Ipomoea nil TaxID=35883 RepID=UPI000901D0D9|nr:PREDICTED: ankyrin repeat-containing protein NPR4-like [Ipomoea nil]
MERMVFEAALKGDVESLKRLLDEDPLVLERSMASGVYSDTPLHVAAMLGYQDFANEILKRKPQLPKELNSNQSSPLHLAAAMGHEGVVRCLLLADRGMCKARDRDGLTPFHLAAVKGRVEVLKELMMSDGHDEICSSSEELLSEVMAMDGEKLGESILHMCVKHGQLEALKFVVEKIGDDADFVNSKDAFGNTVLHLAVENKQFEAVKFLVQHPKIQVKAENVKGLTAKDTLLTQTRNNNVKEMEIGEALVVRRDKEAAKQSKKNIINDEEDNNSDVQSLQSQSSEIKKDKKEKRRKKQYMYKKNRESWVHEMREGLMVAASLLATMAFQAILSPPGSVMQDTKDINLMWVESGYFASILQRIFDFSWVDQDPYLSLAPSPEPMTGYVGESVMSYYKPLAYEVFIMCNTLSFLASLSVILLLISGLPLWHKFFMYVLMITMWVAIGGAAVSYVMCLQMITSWNNIMVAYNLTRIWGNLFATLAAVIGVGHIIMVTVKLIKWLPKALLIFKTRLSKKKKKKNNSSSSMEHQV